MLLRAKITIKIDISNKYPEKMILLARFFFLIQSRNFQLTQVSQVR